MQFRKYLRTPGLPLLGVLALALSLAGCGSGGSNTSVATPGAARNPGGDSGNTSASPGTGGSSSTGCTASTFAPNYASLIPLYRWTHFPLKVYFLNSGVITNSDGQTVDLRAAVLAGLDEWVAATNGDVAYQVINTASGADVTIHFGKLGATPTTDEVLGLEQSTVNSHNEILKADVLLNTWPEMTTAQIGSFQETAAHEFGHALGLNGHSPDPTDVMYASHYIDSFKPLTQQDVNTLKTDYCGQFTRGASPSGADTATRTIVIVN